jgi:hypothetical protein
MFKRRKPVKVTGSKEKLSNRIGVPLFEGIVEKCIYVKRQMRWLDNQAATEESRKVIK